MREDVAPPSAAQSDEGKRLGGVNVVDVVAGQVEPAKVPQEALGILESKRAPCVALVALSKADGQKGKSHAEELHGAKLADGAPVERNADEHRALSNIGVLFRQIA